MQDRATTAAFASMAAQHGVASRRQLRSIGLTSRAEERLARDGAIVRVAPGVLAAAGSPSTFATAAMVASLRPGVRAVSHGTAARLHGLAGFARYSRLDVIGGRGAHLTFDPPVVTHYSRAALDRHLVRVDGIAATSVPLTLVHLASSVPAALVADALADALAHGAERRAIESVAGGLRRRGRRGPAIVLRLLHRM